MIDPAKKKLTAIFLSVLIPLNLLLLIITYIFIDYSAVKGAEIHVRENFVTEFLPHYRRNDFATLGKIVEDELFQLIDRRGETLLSVQSLIEFHPLINKSLLEDAFSGKEVFEIIKNEDVSYMVFYFPIDRVHVGRVIHSMEAADSIQRGYLKIMLFLFPGLLFISFILSRYLVHQSLKPVVRLLTYQETFSSNLTHELNSPLTSIKGDFEVILKKERTPDEYRETIKSALKNINGIINLLNNLYLMATSDSEPLELYKEQVNIKQLIDEVVEKYESLILSRKITLDVSVQPDLYCECDASLMQRAIENLIDNAVKYTPGNGLIGVTVLDDEENYIFTISNTCEGITRDELKNFFEPFYRGKNILNKDVEGGGLGLHIVQYIIQSHGGTIFTRLDEGLLSFTIHLPRYIRP